MITIAVLVVVVLLLTVPPVLIYNNLVTLRNRYKNSYSQIDVQLQRRHDLIPNLVETAKGYLTHERETLAAVMAARNNASAAGRSAAADPGVPSTMAGVAAAESVLTGALGRLMAVVEAYPDLKANQNMMLLMEELTSTENKVSFARQAYNDSVLSYNTSRETFPSSVVAGAFNFERAASFQVENESHRAVPSVQF